jgi:hypothetical protein
MNKINRHIALLLSFVLCVTLFSTSASSAPTGKTVTIQHNIDVSDFLKAEDVVTSGCITGAGTFEIDDAKFNAYIIKRYWGNYASQGHILKAVMVESNGASVTANIPIIEPFVSTPSECAVILTNAQNGLGFGGTGSVVIPFFPDRFSGGQVGISFGEGVTFSDEVVVTFVWDTGESPGHALTVDVAEEAGGNVASQFQHSSGNAAVYRIVATPDVNYMLDYWECTAGEGTYGGTAFDSATNSRIYVPDDYRYSGELTVTLTEESAITAHFKPAKIILLDGASIFPYEGDIGESHYVGLSGAGTSAAVRVGNRAELHFRFRTPSLFGGTANGITVDVELYKGTSAESGDKFFSGSYESTTLNSPNGSLYFVVHIPSIQQMDGFTAVVTMNGGEAVSRYYSLGSGLILDDALENERARARSGLDAVFAYVEQSANYAAVKRLIGITYDAAVETVKTAETADGITDAVNDAIRMMSALANGSAHPEIITVAVSVDKLTVSGEYIVEPTLMRLPAGTNGMHALLALLEAFYPAVEEPYRLKGGYLEGIWDPAYSNESGIYKYPGYLSEKDESAGAGWMYSVNNVFPGVGAGAYVLKDGDVMRWQYTGGRGSNGVSISNNANKNALTLKIAEINSAGTQASYGDKYTAAMSALQKHTAAQSEVDAALAAFYPAEDTSNRDVSHGYGGTVILTDESGHYTVTATAAGYVINAIWVDGVKLADVYGKTLYTTKTAPAASIFASFIYDAGG